MRLLQLLANVPIDEMMAGWTPATLPADWAQVRDRWEAYHTVRTFLSLGGIAATLAGSLPSAERGSQHPRSWSDEPREHSLQAAA